MRNIRRIVVVVLAVVMVLAALPGEPSRAQDAGPGLVVFGSDRSGNYEIYVLDPETGLTTQLTNDPASDIEPMWSPDGTTIAFASNRDGDYDLYVIRGDGTNLRQVTMNLAEDRQPRWQPNGQYITYMSNVNGQWDLYTVTADGAIVRQLTNDLADERGPGVQMGPPGAAPAAPAAPAVTSEPAAPPAVPSGVPDATVDTRELNIRANPGEGARVLSYVPRDTPLEIVGRYSDHSWVQVRAPNGTVGWAFAALLDININLADVPVVSAPFIAPPPTATPTNTPIPYTETPVPEVISFGVDKTTISSGECVNFTWFVEGIKAVFYQGQGVTGSGSRQECPTATTTYTLHVIRVDDTTTDRTITITVNP
jgi:dipeptidyl aminopeptidase/acylaminoacyl peptidase